MSDCLLIGYNDYNFDEYVKMVRSMGEDSGPYRDLNLAFIEQNGKPYRALDILNRFNGEDGEDDALLHNTDFLSPAIAYLGSYLARKELSYDYVNSFNHERDKIQAILSDRQTLCVAITTTFYIIPAPVKEIVDFVRQCNPDVKIILGGPYISQAGGAQADSAQDLFKYLGADYYVISNEGEETLVKLIKALKQGAAAEELKQINNLAFPDITRYVFTEQAVESNPLEDTPINYLEFQNHTRNEFLSIRTAKSCPFACAFCGFPARAGKYKFLDVSEVEQILNEIAAQGEITTLTLIDDTFNVPKARFKDILKMMIRNKYGFKWNAFYRCDHGDPETIELMAHAGCEGVFLGMESGSDTILKAMNKTVRRKDFLESIPLLRENGISSYASLIVGFPGETEDTVGETIELIERTRPDFFRAQLWYADPSTPVWENRETLGVRGKAFSWSHNTMDHHIACDLIDKMFLSVRGSIWLPQWGFEQWSVFYLQRKGMSEEQVKTCIKNFNSIIKAKLLNPRSREANPLLLDSLRKIGDLKRGHMSLDRFIDPFPARRYAQAERFFSAATKTGSVKPPPDTTETERIKLPDLNEKLKNLRETGKIEVSSLILAVYATLLFRINGQADLTIMYGDGQDEEASALPLRLHPTWDLSFRRFASLVHRNISRLKTYAIFSEQIFKTSSSESFRPSSPWAFNIHKKNSLPGETPPRNKMVELLLEATETDEGKTDLYFTFNKSSFNRSDAEELGRRLEHILQAVSENPALKLGDTLANEIHQDNTVSSITSTPTHKDGEEVFHF